jgi:hypothetical protein
MTNEYHLLKTEFDPKNCVIDAMPAGTKQEFRLKSGEVMSKRFPAKASIRMSKSYAGHAVTDSIANTFDFLMVSDRLKQVIAEFRPEGVEYLPFSLENHKNAAVPGGFWIVNLLGSIECADADGTEGKRSSMDPLQFLLLKRLQLREKAIPAGMHLFRLGEMTSKIVVSGSFVQAAKKAGVKGIRYVPMGEKI